MNKKISFIISSKRNYENYAKKVVDCIYKMDAVYPFEIVVCHPEEIQDERIKWVKDDKMIGSSYAWDLAYKNSCGDFIFTCVDDCSIIGNLFGVVDFLNSSAFKNRKFKITTLPGMHRLGAATQNNLTKFESTPKHPKFLLLTNNYINLPDFNVMCFPIASRETIDKELGGCVFHPRVKVGQDWWLGAFLAMNDEIGIQYNNAKFIGEPNQEELEELSEDPILGKHRAKLMGESYINTYRLIKNYKKGMPYIYDAEEDYLYEKTILAFNEFQ